MSHDSAFDLETWKAETTTALLAAGVPRVVSLRPELLAFEWPLTSADPDARPSMPLEIEHQEGGTLVLVRQLSWHWLPVTVENVQLVVLVSSQLTALRRRVDNGFVDVQWQRTSANHDGAPFAIDDYVQVDTTDWLDRLLGSVRRHEHIFRALDPLMQQAARGVFEGGRASVVVRTLTQRLVAEVFSAEVAPIRERFPAVSMERFDDDGVLRALKLEAAPEDALLALDDPLLANVDEVSLIFEDDARARWLDGMRLPRPLRTVEIVSLDAGATGLLSAVLRPFQECVHLSLRLHDTKRSHDQQPVPLSFDNLEVLELDCNAPQAMEAALLRVLLAQPMPKLRRFSLNSIGARDGVIAPLLKRLPATVTELGVWQQRDAWKVVREALLGSPMLARLTAVGVKDDVDEINDPRLAGKKLFGAAANVSNVAHDLQAVGRYQDVVDMLGPLLWKTSDANVHFRYAMAVSELDHEAGLVAWRNVLAISPRHAVATHNLANQLVWMGRLEEAYPVVVEALALSPDDPWMLRCLAVIWQSRGDAAQAAAWSTRFAQAASNEVLDADDDVDGATLYAHACAQMWLSLPEVALRTLEDAVAAGLEGVTPDLDVEWAPVRDDPRWQRLFPRGA